MVGGGRWWVGSGRQTGRAGALDVRPGSRGPEIKVTSGGNGNGTQYTVHGLVLSLPCLLLQSRCFEFIFIKESNFAHIPSRESRLQRKVHTSLR